MIFDFALVVTTICVVDAQGEMLLEARVVLKRGAPLVIGFLDGASTLGRHYCLIRGLGEKPSLLGEDFRRIKNSLKRKQDLFVFVMRYRSKVTL